MPGSRYVEEIGSAAMLAAKRLADIAPEVSLREYAHFGQAGIRLITQRRRHQKSKTSVSMAPQKGLMSSKKNFKRKGQLLLPTEHPQPLIYN